ncbi:MAG: hypothetical protein LBT89_05115 [Planctomycetaceae bacterium]|jgi:hypothetical protein|nr:hypothetical protein [Planctomycetaceae bacterium]
MNRSVLLLSAVILVVTIAVAALVLTLQRPSENEPANEAVSETDTSADAPPETDEPEQQPENDQNGRSRHFTPLKELLKQNAEIAAADKTDTDTNTVAVKTPLLPSLPTPAPPPAPPKPDKAPEITPAKKEPVNVPPPTVQAPPPVIPTQKPLPETTKITEKNIDSKPAQQPVRDTRSVAQEAVRTVDAGTNSQLSIINYQFFPVYPAYPVYPVYQAYPVYPVYPVATVQWMPIYTIDFLNSGASVRRTGIAARRYLLLYPNGVTIMFKK